MPIVCYFQTAQRPGRDLAPSTASVLAGRFSALFRKKRFMLDKMFQRNASKFAIFYMYENSNLLFLFFIPCYLIFSPNECPDLCRHRPGHSLGEEIKQYKMKNIKKCMGFLMSKVWQILKHFAGTFHREQTLKL